MYFEGEIWRLWYQCTKGELKGEMMDECDARSTELRVEVVKYFSLTGE